jgi:hypothetical protein
MHARDGAGPSAGERTRSVPVAARDSAVEREATRFAAGGPAPCLACACGRACSHKGGPAPGLVPSGGASLDGDARAELEARTGADLGGVRVHTGGDAAAAARAMSARAFTLGNDIVFGAGRYEPGSAAGRALIAHEVAHVLQGGHELRRNGDDDDLDAGVARVDPIAGIDRSPPRDIPEWRPPPRPLTFPCNVDLRDLTNERLADLLWTAHAYMQAHPRADRFYDYLHLQRRLSPIRHQRVAAGEMWLAGRDPHPSSFYRIRASEITGHVEVVSEPRADALGDARSLGGDSVVNRAQLTLYFEGAGVPGAQVAPAIEAIRSGEVFDLDLARATELNEMEAWNRARPLRDMLFPFAADSRPGPTGTGRPGVGAGSLAGGSVRSPVPPTVLAHLGIDPGRVSTSIMGVVNSLLGANQGLRTRYVGAIGEGSLEARREGYYDLDTLTGARNFPDWDGMIADGRRELLQAKTQEHAPSERGLSILYGALERAGGRPHDTNLARWNQADRLALATDRAGVAVDPAEVVELARVAVNDDNVDTVRDYVRGRLRRRYWRDLYLAIIRNHHVSRDGSETGPRYTVDDFHHDLPEDGSRVEIPDAVADQVAQIAAETMVVGHGVTTAEVQAVMRIVDGHVRNARATAPPGTGEGEILRMGVRRLTAEEVEVAMRPGRTAARGASGAVIVHLLMTLVNDAIDTISGHDVDVAGDMATSLETAPIMALAGGVDPLLRGRLPSTRLGGALGPRLTGGLVGLGGAAITGPAVTFATMAGSSHSYDPREYAVMMGRAAAVGIAAFTLEAIITAGLTGGAAGTAVEPGGGTVVGFIGGILIGIVAGAIADALLGDPIEQMLREMIGEPSGCGEGGHP